MKLLFIRHGESVANTEGRLQGQMDSPLTDLGREQAHALARRLVRECWPVSSIHSSDLRRAAETAEIEQQYPELWRISRQSHVWPQVPGEEGDEALHQRVVSVLDHVRSIYDQEQVVAVVSHGRAMAMMLMHLLGIDPGRRTPFRFGNASLSVVELRPHEDILASLNDLCHLSEGLQE